MARDTCVCCPYPFLAVPALLSFVAFILTWIAAISCNFYTITYDGRRGFQIGLWTVESSPFDNNYTDDEWAYTGPSCTGWQYATFLDSSDLDSALRAARAFGMISLFLALFSFVLILIPSCVMFDETRNQYLLILCGMCIFTGIATLLDLVALASSLCTEASDCRLQSAGIVSIVAGVMWFLTAGLLFFALKNPRSTREAETFALGTTATLEPEQAMPMEQKDLQTVQNADGTTTQTTTTTIVNADGSKTVTRTTETIAADEAA